MVKYGGIVSVPSPYLLTWPGNSLKVVALHIALCILPEFSNIKPKVMICLFAYKLHISFDRQELSHHLILKSF